MGLVSVGWGSAGSYEKQEETEVWVENAFQIIKTRKKNLLMTQELLQPTRQNDFPLKFYKTNQLNQNNGFLTN